MIGGCPNCGSSNVHDCEIQTPIMEKLPISGDYFQFGSNCPIAKKIEDIDAGLGVGIGHCDDCNFLWCLDCGSELSIEDPHCGHWGVCTGCSRSKINLDETPNCPYEADITNCLKIKRWKKITDKTKSHGGKKVGEKISS